MELDTEALLVGLDPDQREAVSIAASPLAIIAAAGSGKTTVLSRRIAYRISADPDVQAQHVLALTFTSQAANELQRRLRRVGLRDRVEAGTFHAIALRLLRQRAIDAGQRPPVVASDRGRLVNEALRAIGSKDDPNYLLAELDWARARRVPFAGYALAAKRAGRRTNVGSAQLAALADAYTTVKRRRGVVDFDDLLEQCLHAFTADKLWGAGVRWRFRHLFVDEAQDLNPLQHALLEAIRDGRPDLCLVGDPRQAIFGFNGADPAIMLGVEQIYPGITIIRLRKNYRCSPQIIEASRVVLKHVDQVDDSVAAAHDGQHVRVVQFDSEAAEATGVAHVLRDLAGGQRRWRSCAVLARTVAQLNTVAQALTKSGIPTNLQGRADNSRALTSALGEAYGQRNPIDLGTWIEAVNGEGSTNSVRARVAEAADRYLAQDSGLSLRAWVELHSPFADLEQSEPYDAVDLLTFHGAKGREWQTVVIVGAEHGLVPHSTAVTPEQRGEEARLLYVACTRAREQLVITWAGKRRDRPSRPSALIEGIADASASDAPVGPPERRPPRPGPDPVHVALQAWRKNAARAAEVEPSAICSDESLRAVAQARPRTIEDLVALTDLGPLSAVRIAPRMFAALNRAVGNGAAAEALLQSPLTRPPDRR